MGLEERRKVKTFEEETFPELKAAIDEAATFEVDIEVHWDTLTEMENLKLDLWEDAWTKIFFKPLEKAFEEITIDDLGQQALVAGLDSVVVTNEAGHRYASDAITFEDGVLTIDHQPNVNVRDVDKRTETIVSKLEADL